jgi:hypothetical protein
VRRLLGAVLAVAGEAAAMLERNLEFDYARPRQKPDCDWHSKPAREALLRARGEDAERALRALEQVPELAQAEPVSAAARLLRELIGQDFALDADALPRLRRATAASGDSETREQLERRHERNPHQETAQRPPPTRRPRAPNTRPAQPTTPAAF